MTSLTAAALRFVLPALVLATGAGCAATADDAGSEDVELGQTSQAIIGPELPQGIIGPEQPVILGYGIDAYGRLYEDLDISAKVHDEALKGAPYTLVAKWTYRDGWGPTLDASTAVDVRDLKVTTGKDPSRLRTTVRLSLANWTKNTTVIGATAEIR